MEKEKVKTVYLVKSPSFNEWMKEFNVASRYVSNAVINGGTTFDLNKFKRTIKEKKWEE